MEMVGAAGLDLLRKVVTSILAKTTAVPRCDSGWMFLWILFQSSTMFEGSATAHPFARGR
eukprot:7922950-Pyramimonas_sp.AAC.1